MARTSGHAMPPASRARHQEQAPDVGRYLATSTSPNWRSPTLLRRRTPRPSGAIPPVQADLETDQFGPAGGSVQGLIWRIHTRRGRAGQYPVCVGETTNVADLAEDAGQDRPDADQVGQPGATGRDELGELGSDLADLTIELDERQHEPSPGVDGSKSGHTDARAGRCGHWFLVDHHLKPHLTRAMPLYDHAACRDPRVRLECLWSAD
jgi:hypothetical protein